MAQPPNLRDSRLIDVLDSKTRQPFASIVWRVAREGRDPVQCSAPGGRWDDGTFDVLYTALESSGAVAEMHFHLQRGQPVFPSKLRYALHELKLALSNVITLSRQELAELGLNMAQFGQFAYDGRTSEYPTSQQIAEAAHFLDATAIIVPNARWDCNNLVIFCDRISPGDVDLVKDHGLIAWASWTRKHQSR